MTYKLHTIVIFATDNGAEVFTWPDGGMTPFRATKGTTFEGGFRVPAIIRWPGKVKPGSVVVDCSSSDPTSTTALAAELQAAGIAFADAPLSRTPKEAWEGTLDVMVGAEDAVFVLQRSLLSSFNFRAAS